MSAYRQHDWRPLSAGLGKTTKVKINPDGSATIRTEEDEKPRLDLNHHLRVVSASDGGFIDKNREMKRVASIPAALVVKWLVEEGLDVYDPDHAERLMRKLNDPDYAYLRTAPGQLAMTDNGNFR